MFALLWFACANDPLDGLTLVGLDPSDGPLPGLDEAWMDRFFEGDALFEAPFREADGLGPVYIRHACASCHADDARGPGAVERFVLVQADGVTPQEDQSALPWGHTARPHVAGGGVTPLSAPERDDLLRSVRAPPGVFGRGYLEAVLDEEILRVAQAQAARGDSITGRPNRVAWAGQANPETEFHTHGPGDTQLIGRFGLKARVATLDGFAADALLGDMSITTPILTEELPNPDGLDDDLLPGVDLDLESVNRIADYTRLVDIPAREPTEGAELFEAADCAACHTPRLRTRPDHPIPQLADIDAPIYTDLLLHDMGAGASDGLWDAEASPSEWRTAPLIGLRHLRSYLHDGRALTVEEAILLHRGEGSEANGSIDAYEALGAEDQATLLRFVESL